MTKLRHICLAFVRWRERRAWVAYLRWQRAGWRLHGYAVGKLDRDMNPSQARRAANLVDGVRKAAGTVPPPGREDPMAPSRADDGKQDGYFLRPGWRDVVIGGPDPGMPQGPSVDNIRKAGGA